MKIGILGTSMGAYHASLYKNIKGVDAIRLYGRNTEKLDQIRKDLDIEVTDKMEDIFNDPGIDLVDVCLPGDMHLECTRRALAAGKHVFVETPFAETIEDANEMQRLQQEYGQRVFVNMFIKFENSYTYLHDMVSQGSLGKLKTLHMRRKTPPMWGDLGLSRISVQLMIHEFDFLNELLGYPEQITSAGICSSMDQSNVDVMLKYRDTCAFIHSSSMMPNSHAFTVGYEAIFENGTIEFVEDGYKKYTEKSLKLFTPENVETINLPDDNCFEASLAHVVDCCINGSQTCLSIDEAIKSLELALVIKSQIE